MKMRYSLCGSAGAFAAAAALSLTYAPSAHALGCDTLENPVYVTGSSAVRPFLAKVAAKLRQATPPINVVYRSSGSCDGVANMAGAPTDASSKIDATGLVIWDNDGVAISGGCDTPIGGVSVDIGASDVYASTCDATVASDVGDFHGPVQTMTFVVHPESTATSISAEAAYLIYGFGAKSHVVAPFSDETVIFQRGPSSGTQGMIAKAINVGRSKWLGDPALNVPANGSAGMLGAVIASKANNKQAAAIGILAADLADANSTVKQLAYKHYGQSCGYLPNSEAGKFDKKNVRDGHYFIWGPLHMYARKGSNGRPSSADAKAVIEVLEGTSELDGLDLIKTEATSGVVPACAMRVSRDTEVGPLSSSAPDKMCGCKYEKDATGSTSCQACPNGPSDCTGADKKCNYGYCEAK